MRLVGYISCIAGSATSEERAAVVVDWEGNIYLPHETAATVAELMLEAPGHLIASADEARRTRRVLAMRADEPLRPGGVYLLFPAGRAGSRVLEPQMKALDGALGARKRRAGRKSRRPGAGDRVFLGVVACNEEGKEGLKKLEEGRRRPVSSTQGDDGGFPGCDHVASASPGSGSPCSRPSTSLCNHNRWMEGARKRSTSHFISPVVLSLLIHLCGPSDGYSLSRQTLGWLQHPQAFFRPWE